MRAFLHVTGILLIAQPAAAQFVDRAKVSAQRFEPALDSRGIMDLEWADAPDQRGSGAAMWLGYSNDPIKTSADSGDGRLLEHRLDMDLTATYAAFSYLQVGIGFRATLFQARPESVPGLGAMRDIKSSGAGDLRLAFKTQVFNQEDHYLHVSLFQTFVFATAASDYFGEGSFSYRPQLLVAREFGALRTALAFGWIQRARKQYFDIEIDDAVTYRVGAAYKIIEPVELGLVLSGSFLARNPFFRDSESPLELLASGSYALPRDLQVYLGTSSGLTAAFGSPDFRFMMGLRYERTYAKTEPTPYQPPLIEAYPPTDVTVETPAGEVVPGEEPQPGEDEELELELEVLPPKNPDRAP